MEIHELVIEMKYLERRLTPYEEKYGILSEDFYTALMSDKLAAYDDYDETRIDFSRWKGIYETWMRRKKAYTRQKGRKRRKRRKRFLLMLIRLRLTCPVGSRHLHPLRLNFLLK